jgi:hypothetical protein
MEVRRERVSVFVPGLSLHGPFKPVEEHAILIPPGAIYAKNRYFPHAAPPR